MATNFMPNSPPATIPNGPWLVYVLECSDGSFYTGVTNDLVRRVAQHNEGTGARYTRSRRPVTVCYQQPCADRSSALIRECALRLLSRKEKEALVGSYAIAAKTADAGL